MKFKCDTWTFPLISHVCAESQTFNFLWRSSSSSLYFFSLSITYQHDHLYSLLNQKKYFCFVSITVIQNVWWKIHGLIDKLWALRILQRKQFTFKMHSRYQCIEKWSKYDMIWYEIILYSWNAARRCTYRVNRVCEESSLNLRTSVIFWINSSVKTETRNPNLPSLLPQNRDGEQNREGAAGSHGWRLETESGDSA